MNVSRFGGRVIGIGGFQNIAKPFSSNTHYLSIYNVGVPGANAYELANVITPPGTQIDIASGPAAHTADSSAVEGRIEDGAISCPAITVINLGSSPRKRSASYQVERQPVAA